jgi:hypothetical protein
MSQSDDSEDSTQTISSTSHAPPISVKFPPVIPSTVQTVETPLQWSARMKRYQEEEIEYLGLTTIKPILSANAPTVSRFDPRTPVSCVVRESTTPISEPSRGASEKESRIFGNSSRRDVQVPLSRRRFEEWMDGLSGMASPSVTVSRPSTVVDSEDDFSGRVSGVTGDERDVSTVTMESCQVSGEEDDVGTVRMVESERDYEERKVCVECGREMLRESSREWGVQTDISSRLIVF